MHISISAGFEMTAMKMLVVTSDEAGQWQQRAYHFIQYWIGIEKMINIFILVSF